MPKQIIDYSKNIIYKMVCNDLNVKDVYVGHTTNFINRTIIKVDQIFNFTHLMYIY